jgi:hypothetical protein
MSKTAIKVITSVQPAGAGVRRRRNGWCPLRWSRGRRLGGSAGSGHSSEPALWVAMAAVPAAAAISGVCGGTGCAGAAPAGLPSPGLIDVEFANRARMRITGAVDPATLSATIAMLASGERRR